MSLIERALKKVEPEDSLGTKGKSSGAVNKKIRGKGSTLRNKHNLQDMAEKSNLGLDELRKLGIATDRKTANAFRELRTELVKSAGGKNFVLAVSTCKDKSGNTFVATNLALSFAQDATKSALIIDCNFRRPSIAQNFGIDIKHDLTDYLTGDVAVEDIIYSVKVNKLRVIPSRVSDLHEIDSFTTSSKLGELIYELKNKFPDRYIILDVSDIESSADAKILDLIADHSVLVAGHDTVTPEELQIAIDGFNPAKFLGIIYNHCPG
jgi:Mrp family chromosome partitioning ATPase